MKHFESEMGGRVIVIRLDRGELVLESIERTIRELNLTDGTIVCGYGTLSRCNLHMVETHDVFPAGNSFPKWEEKPLELISMSGVIANGVPHIHTVIAEGMNAYAGHMEHGCATSYLTEIVIYEHKNLKLVRKETVWGEGGPTDPNAQQGPEALERA